MVSDGIVAIVFPIRWANCLHEMAHEERQIFRALPQRGHVHRKDVDAIEQVSAELLWRRPARPDHGSWPRSAVHPCAGCARCRGGSNSRSCSTRSSFGCTSSGSSHLIEKHGAPVRQFEATDALCNSTRKSPFLVSEEFTFRAGRLEWPRS